MIVQKLEFTKLLNLSWVTLMDNQSISIGIVGDFCLSGYESNSVEEIKKELEKVSFLNKTRDLTIANLEFCITPKNKYMGSMSLPAEKCQGISDSGFSLFCLANNHIKDYGEKSMLFTRDFLNNKGIQTVGVGTNFQTAIKPIYFSIKEKKIAVINVTDATHYQATSNSGGVAPLNKNRLLKQVIVSAEEADITIVVIHSDLEFTNFPAPWRVKLSRKLVDNGGDLVVHHHSHTLQGIEYYKGALIAYSLGNFIFPIHKSSYMQGREGKVDEGGYLAVTIDFRNEIKTATSHEMMPTIIDEKGDFQVASGQQEKTVLNSIEEYSLQLENMKKLEYLYFQRCKHEMKSFLLGVYYALRKNGISSARKYFFHHLTTAQHTNWVRGFFSLGKL